MRLCISGIVLLVLMCVTAFGGMLRLPNPPEVPTSGMDADEAKSLADRRADLLKRKRAILADMKKYNDEVSGGVAQEKEAFYKDWQSRLVADSESYRDTETRFRDDLKRARLRVSIKGIQESLRRLDRSIQSDVKQLAEWEKTTQETVEHAREMLLDVVIDTLLAVPQDRAGKIYEGLGREADAELQRVAVLISGETDGARRERLHSAYKLLAGQRDSIRNVQALLGNLRQAQSAKDLADLADLPEGKRFAEGVKQLLALMDDPALDEALAKQVGLKLPAATLLGRAAVHYRYGEKLVDVTYDVTAVSLSLARIRQLNRNTDEYLHAVDRLKQRMEKTVEMLRDVGNEKRP